MIKEHQFVARRVAGWAWWDRWLAEQDAGLGASTTDLASVPPRFRALCHDLALAERRCYSTPLVAALQARVLRVHQQVYGTRPRPSGLRDFLRRGLAQAVRRNALLCVLSASLLLGPLATGTAVVTAWPATAAYVLSPQALDALEEMYGPDTESPGRPRAATTDVAMYLYYLSHNVRIGFQTFAGGMVFGLGTVAVLLFNGVALGASAGHLTATGNGTAFWSFVAGHSAFELLGIVLCGAAGLTLARGLLRPGRRERIRALRDEAAADAVPLLGGGALLIALAAIVEAFWSPLPLPPGVKYAVGGLLWVVTLAYLSAPGLRRAA